MANNPWYNQEYGYPPNYSPQQPQTTQQWNNYYNYPTQSCPQPQVSSNPQTYTYQSNSNNWYPTHIAYQPPPVPAYNQPVPIVPPTPVPGTVSDYTTVPPPLPSKASAKSESNYFKELDNYLALKRKLYMNKDDTHKTVSRDHSRSRARSRSRQRSRSLSTNRKRSRYDSHSSRTSSKHRDSSRSRNKSPATNKEENKPVKEKSERDILLSQWRKHYCGTREELQNKIKELLYNDDKCSEREQERWTRSTPADLFYKLDEDNPKITTATKKLSHLCETFYDLLICRAAKANATKPKYVPPPRTTITRVCKHKTEEVSSDSSDDDNLTSLLHKYDDCGMAELSRKQLHPDRLHSELWYNDPGEMNDGPLCRCSKKSRRSGIRHGIYAGEQFLQRCNKNSNNADKLYHYRVTISPPTNFLTKTPSIIHHDEHEFIFEGFSMFSHNPLIKLPTCKVIRFNIQYSILYVEEKMPTNFTILELDLFYDYLFKEILELIDLDLKAADDSSGCAQFHFMPRFVRELPDNGKEILSMNNVLEYLMYSSVPLIHESELPMMLEMSQYKWQDYADELKGMIVTYPGKKPCSIRVDQVDRDKESQTPGSHKFPSIVHFGIRPPQLSYAGNPEYQKAWREYVKFRHLLANMSKRTFEDKRKLEAKEARLLEMRSQNKMKRDVTIAISAKGFFRTGIMCDIIQHAMLIPVLVSHLRFHNSLAILESSIQYQFKNRTLLQLALTHPSYRENFGTNPDHARNSLTNCGIRQPEYGDRRIHYMNTRKRGINTLINIMSRFGKKQETESNITHNERLEFLGDAVVEFLTSVHLFFLFPDLEEGGLATYRAAIVQNQHLAVLARVQNLDRYMLYAHGSDLCHDLELRHAMANCFEALMGALFLDGGIEVADYVFSQTFFHDTPTLFKVWRWFPPHPLQVQEPMGDRHWIDKFDLLAKLAQFEETIGIQFRHIRVLARAFTDRSVGYTNLTLGSNQRLEFLGDTVLQLIASDYLYKYFPEHHEGHLSLLRSSLVNNRTQAVVCDDLGLATYAVYNNPKADLKTKDRADLLEAFIGALFVDKGIEHCEIFCMVTLFPRLQDFIMNQDWNDPKSKLQQCCLTLRTMSGGEPDIPIYKVIECKGPTNTRVYTVAVYFRGDRLAKASGHSIQQAEMNAAKKALENSHDLFPQLDHQKRVIAKSMKKQKKKILNKQPGEYKQSQKSTPTRDNRKTRNQSPSARPPSSRLKDFSRSESRSRLQSQSARNTLKVEKVMSSCKSKCQNKSASPKKKHSGRNHKSTTSSRSSSSSSLEGRTRFHSRSRSLSSTCSDSWATNSNVSQRAEVSKMKSKKRFPSSRSNSNTSKSPNSPENSPHSRKYRKSRHFHSPSKTSNSDSSE